MPPVFKNVFNNNIVYLSDARFIGHLLPSTEISSNYLQISFLPIAFIIYIPLLFIVTKLSVPIASIVDKFKHVDIYRWRFIQATIFLAFSACLATTSIYLFYETSIINAFFTLLFAVFIVTALTSGNQQR